VFVIGFKTFSFNIFKVIIMIFIMLYDGYTVPEKFYNVVLYQVREILPALIPGEKYTLELLCGDAFWLPLSDGQRRMAGRCMAHMVNNDQLPLCFAITKHEYPKRYQLL